VVQELAVVAHQQQRALELEQQLLEQVERLDVEIVRRLVEHQQVERAREQPRQQQPVALPAAQRAHRRARPLGREEEVLQVAEHVPLLAADAHPLAAVGDAVEDAAVRVELLAQLVVVRDLEPRAVTDRARVRRQLAEQQAQERRLARAVRADEPHAVAAHDRGREVAHDRAVAVREATSRTSTTMRPERSPPVPAA
jgi:hypothetical protein